MRNGDRRLPLVQGLFQVSIGVIDEFGCADATSSRVKNALGDFGLHVLWLAEPRAFQVVLGPHRNPLSEVNFHSTPNHR